MRATPIMRFDTAIRVLYEARRPLTSKRRAVGLDDAEADMLASLEAALDVLEMAESFHLKRLEKD